MVFKWEVPEPGTPEALRLREDYRNGVHELLAPDVLPVEVANALFVAERQGRIAAGHFPGRLADVLRFSPVLYQSTSLLPRAATIAHAPTSVKISIYDCLYVALAEREGCELVTADARLMRALRASYPLIIDLAAF